MTYFILINDGQSWKLVQQPFQSYQEADAFAQQNYPGMEYKVMTEQQLRQLSSQQGQQSRSGFYRPPTVRFPVIRF